MTLSTNIAIVDPVPPKDLFDYCRSLIGGKNARMEHSAPSPWGSGTYMTVPGQGLHAWTFVHYALDGPLILEDEATIAGYREDDPSYQPPPCNQHLIRVDFDTGYGYQENGAGCSDLHAWLIVKVGEWLDERGARWWWEDEFNGQWYPQTVSPDGILGRVSVGALA